MKKKPIVNLRVHYNIVEAMDLVNFKRHRLYFIFLAEIRPNAGLCSKFSSECNLPM